MQIPFFTRTARSFADEIAVVTAADIMPLDAPEADPIGAYEVVVIHCQHRDYIGVVQEANYVTDRAIVRFWDDVLMTWRTIGFDLERLERFAPNENAQTEVQALS